MKGIKDNMMSIDGMGGYGSYIIASYSIVFLGLALIWIRSIQKAKRLQIELREEK